MTARVYVSDLNNIVWHPKQNYTYVQYKQALDSVFDGLYYRNAKKRFQLIGSYRMNLRHIVLYAIDNDIDELEHIKSLREILLNDIGVYDLTK